MYKILFDFENDLQARALEYFCVSLFGKSCVVDEWFDSPDEHFTSDLAPSFEKKTDCEGGSK